MKRDVQKRVLIAIDALQSKPSTIKNAYKSISALGRQAGLSQRVVSVLGPTELFWPYQFQPDWLTAIGEMGTNKLTKLLGHLDGGQDVSSQILVQPETAKSYQVKAFSDYASSTDAGLIALVTHANKRKGWFPVGSFAEKLMMMSKVPVLAINAKSKPVAKVSRIVFATDFSDECRRAYDEVLRIAKMLNCEVLLFYHILTPPGTVYVAGSALAMPQAELAELYESNRAEMKAVAKKWREIGLRQGVRTRAVVDENSGAASKKVLAVASKPTDLIAIAVRSGPFEAAILGSTTREVLRNSKQPVLLINPSQLKREVANVRPKSKESHEQKPENSTLLGTY